MWGLHGGREDDWTSTGWTAEAARSERLSSSPYIAANAAEIPALYDLTLSRPDVEQVSFSSFESLLARAATAHGLSCGLIHDGIVHEAIRRLSDGRLRIGFHLDYFALWHVPDDPYARLAQAVQDAGGRAINPPARSRLFTDKAAAHAELVRNGFGVPATIFVRPWAAESPLTPAQWNFLRLEGSDPAVYLKPANGFGGNGVARLTCADPEKLAQAVTAARRQDTGETWLIQREVRFPQLRCDDGIARPAYWRVLQCLGDFLAFWWDGSAPKHGLPAYREVTLDEVRCHNLRPLYDAAEALTDLCGLEWFSTEICLSDGKEPSRFQIRGPDGSARPLVVIDYFNDQCDVDVQSRSPGAPPDAVVAHVAARFADAAARRRDLRSRPTFRLAA
jgi:hypothetical protein